MHYVDAMVTEVCEALPSLTVRELTRVIYQEVEAYLGTKPREHTLEQVLATLEFIAQVVREKGTA